MKWHENIVDMINKSNKLEMRKHDQMQKLDARRCGSGHARHQSMQAMRILAKARVEVLNGIRQCFRVRERR